MECLSARWDIDPSGEIIVLTTFCPVSMVILIPIFDSGLLVGCGLQLNPVFSSTYRLVFNIDS